MCSRCRRPVRVCYCAALPTLPTRTRVVILQHPRERDMPIGTARMASLCLPNAQLHVGLRWGEHAGLAEALGNPAAPPILLWPGEGAIDVLAEPPQGPVTLVVVDGTWSQAKTVVRDNPVLRALPRYAFVTPEKSQYRIRREPDDAFVSTIEALMHVLGALEGDAPRFRALLDPLNAMVDAQLECQRAQPSHRVRKPRAARDLRSRLPQILFERAGDLVCIAAEANAWPYRTHATYPDELIHFVAVRPATGEVFAQTAAPEQPLSPSACFHSGLDADVLHASPPRAALVDAFARWQRPTDVVCTWGHYAAELYGMRGQTDLRAAAQRMLHAKVGAIETFAATLGPAPAPLAPGRAGRRAALLAQILAAWR
jgi:DTW domain-containing protein YfiP